MSTIEEKRVYSQKEGSVAVFLATGVGLARVEVSADLVGEFGLERRGAVRDVAGDAGRLAVATDDDVLLATDEGFTDLGFGPADAVDVGAGVVAAGDGRVARYADGEWTTLGEVEEARAVDGDMVAAAGGVYRLDGTHVGLTDVRDVSTAGTPLAATDDGLYYLGNGWMDAHDGAFEVVESDADGERAHAGGDGLVARGDSEDDWRTVDLPDEVTAPIAGIGYRPGTVYAVTEDGVFLADAGDGWRTHTLGLPDVRALAVP